jgi:hypothetical protein
VSDPGFLFGSLGESPASGLPSSYPPMARQLDAESATWPSLRRSERLETVLGEFSQLIGGPQARFNLILLLLERFQLAKKLGFVLIGIVPRWWNGRRLVLDTSAATSYEPEASARLSVNSCHATRKTLADASGWYATVGRGGPRELSSCRWGTLGRSPVFVTNPKAMARLTLAEQNAEPLESRHRPCPRRTAMLVV